MIGAAPLERIPLLAGLSSGLSAGQQRRAIRVGAVLLPDETIESMLREETDSSARNASDCASCWSTSARSRSASVPVRYQGSNSRARARSVAPVIVRPAICAPDSA